MSIPESPAPTPAVGEAPSARSRKRARRSLKVRLLVDGVKEAGRCALCGLADAARLGFHHLDPAIKRFDIGSSRRRYGLRTVRSELVKCCILCRSCHCAVHCGTVDGSGLVTLQLPVSAPEMAAPS